MAKQTYLEKLKDPRWQKRRLGVLERDGFKCKICGDSEKTLHVHHKNYAWGREPWEYTDENFITLCAECHDWEHHYKEAIDGLIHDALLMGQTHKSIYEAFFKVPIHDTDFRDPVNPKYK